MEWYHVAHDTQDAAATGDDVGPVECALFRRGKKRVDTRVSRLMCRLWKHISLKCVQNRNIYQIVHIHHLCPLQTFARRFYLCKHSWVGNQYLCGLSGDRQCRHVVDIDTCNFKAIGFTLQCGLDRIIYAFDCGCN